MTQRARGTTAALLCGVLGCSSSPTPSAPAESTPVEVTARQTATPPGRLLFVRESEDRLTTALADTRSGEMPFAHGLTGSVFPGPTDPRGTHALLISTTGGPEGHREQLWLAPLDGGDAHALCPPAGSVRNPAWSRDGASVVFESDALSFRDLFRVPREGGTPARLTDAPHGSFEGRPSPDGAQVVFASSRDGNAELYMMNTDGATARRLTDHPTDDVRPRWSPAGDAIAWLTARDGAPRVWTMADDGTDMRPLRPMAKAVDLDLAWSPSGRHIAVVEQTGPHDVRIVVLDREGREHGVIDGPGVDEHPAWSPDGSWLAFTTSRAGNPDVWIATADGSQSRPVSASPAPEWLPRWQRPME